MDNNKITQLLSIVLVILIVILFALCIVFLVLKLKDKKINTSKPKNTSKEKNVKKEIKTKNKTNVPTYNKQSIFDFMEFDKIQDNMIVQKNGKRYLAVVECLGVNYDLMSRLEKNSVEEGFQQFLNTLRHPIQIYIQTRTMNLEKSIQTYKDKVKIIEEDYNKLSRQYNAMKQSDAYSEEDLKKEFFELTRNRNLLEYGKDIIANTERMSLNKNVLTKKYYIVIPYYAEEAEKYSVEEIRNMAFSELYTKAQSILSTLSACSVTGKILNSNELVELLYMAYNREDADIYGLDKALRAEYDSLYSTAPDVFEKKLKVLDEEIHDRAIDLANQKIEEVKSKAQQKAEEKEDSMDDLIRKMAKIVLNENKAYVGGNIAKEAIKEIEKDEGGENDETTKKKTTTRRSNSK